MNLSGGRCPQRIDNPSQAFGRLARESARRQRFVSRAKPCASMCRYGGAGNASSALPSAIRTKHMHYDGHQRFIQIHEGSDSMQPPVLARAHKTAAKTQVHCSANLHSGERRYAALHPQALLIGSGFRAVESSAFLSAGINLARVIHGGACAEEHAAEAE